jgi:hypothetical protein
MSSPTDPTEPTGEAKPAAPKTQPLQPDTETFQAYKEQAAKAPSAAESAQVSPMDLATKPGISTTPTFQTLTAQAQNAQDTLGEVQKNLNTQNLTLKKSQTDLLNSKLTNANQYLAQANQKIGANVPAQTQVPEDANPITQFLGMVSDGQNKLAEANAALQNQKTQGNLQPGDMMLVQVKLSQAQQEIEYSSILLNQIVSSFKQVLNIQM